MAHPDTLRSHAKSLLKRGMITEKQHERMLNKIAAMAPPSPENAPGPAAADPALNGAAQVPDAPVVSATTSMPSGGQQNPAVAQVPA